jgi:CRP/FNR family transcriptional regulator, cyclic AMP receptor protein
MVPIAKRGVRKTFAAGSVLMEHGRHSNSLHLLLRGRARVERTFGLDRPQLVAEIGPGDLVGEMGSFSGIARSATVKAVDEVESLELSEAALKSVLRHDHPLMVALVRMMNERYKNL